MGSGFPPHEIWNQVPAAEVREDLRDAFTRWGRPDRLRLDNGHPWGSWNDLPRELALWLIGLGVGVTWNHPRCPQENGRVERTQGVTQQWVESPRCRDHAALAPRLAWAATMQREHYPAVGGRTRRQAFPQLEQPRRPYARDQELALWDRSRVDQFLAGGLWRRRVSTTGQISLYNRNYRVGRPHAGQEVSVQFDPIGREWVVQDSTGQELARHTAEQITQERIMSLTVMHRRIHKQSYPGT